MNIKKLADLRLFALAILTMVCLQQKSLAAPRLISVDLQSSYGTEGRNFSGVDPEAADASPLFSTANLWNHIGTTGFDVTTDVFGLVDSGGNPTSVGFKTSGHGAYGSAAFGPSDLLNDYFYWDGPQNPLQWELNGLQPGATYALFLNGSQSNASQPRRFLMTVDMNGDGSLADETGVEVVSPSGTFLASIVANADGKILGTGTSIGFDEPNWGGFQLAGPLLSAEQIDDLIAVVNVLPKTSVTIKNGLLVKLQAAREAYVANDIAAACTAMQDFINLASAQAGKKHLSTDVANDLITAALQIQSVLGCP